MHNRSAWRARIVVAVAGLLLVGSGLALAVSSYLQPFDGAPAAPQPYTAPIPGLAAWDVTVHTRDSSAWQQLEPMEAQHGADCSPPPATHHLTGAYEDSVFQCRDHIMTALQAGGYGVIYLTPPVVADWSDTPTVIQFDMSTARTSQRDWIDLWVSPYDEQLQLPLEDWLPDLNGVPKDAVHIKMDNGGGGSVFRGLVARNFSEADIGENWWTSYESMLTPSATVRTTFQLILSRTHIKFGMPAYNFWWVDTDVADLGWSQGVVQLGHHSYNPYKDCPAGATCGPNTWHWDNVSVSPSLPFTITRAQQTHVDPTTPSTVTFPTPAVAGDHLRFVAAGSQVQVSFDGGATWQAVPLQPAEKSAEDKAQNYWMPVPPGTQRVDIRAQGGWWGSWQARDFSLWGAVASGGTVPPSPTAIPTLPPPPPTAIPTLPPAPTALPTLPPPPPPTVAPPTPTRMPTVLPVPTPNPAGFTATFDDPVSGTPRWVPPGWDWTIDAGYSSEGSAFLNPSLTDPPACDGTQAPTTAQHGFDYATWRCPDHLVFRTNDDSYGHQFLAPPVLLDFTSGEAVFSWDMSTLRASAGRDWIELWVSPLAESIPNPDGRYLLALPKDAVWLKLENPSRFSGHVTRNLLTTDLPLSSTDWTSVLTPSGSRLDRFELHLTRTHIKFGLPAYNLWWVDQDVADLGWTQGVVQLGQAVYKSNLDGGITNWALDNVAAAPVAPLTILRGDNQAAREGFRTVQFPAPAPTGAVLKFMGLGSSQSVSFDGGVTYQRVSQMPVPIAIQGSAYGENSEHYTPYQVAIPAGVQSVMFQGLNVTWFNGAWEAHDIAVYAGGSQPLVTPIPTATAPVLVTATPPMIPIATMTPAVLPTVATVEPSPSPASTLLPTVTATLVATDTPTVTATAIVATTTPTTTATLAVTDTPTATATPLATDIPTSTTIPTVVPSTSTPTATVEPSTPTPTSTATTTATATIKPATTPTPSPTPCRRPGHCRH